MSDDRRIDWDSYRACGVCRRPTGRACVAMSGAIAHGRPDSAVKELAIPHPARKLRAGRTPYKAEIVLDDEQAVCEGHESLRGEDMGVTVFCDGSCRKHEAAS